jgi:hypothetical protein
MDIQRLIGWEIMARDEKASKTFNALHCASTPPKIPPQGSLGLMCGKWGEGGQKPTWLGGGNGKGGSTKGTYISNPTPPELLKAKRSF